MAQTKQSNNTTWFMLGREPLLSTAELFSLINISDHEKYKYEPPFLFLSKEIPLNLMNRLGGTIKIASELGTDLNEESLVNLMKKEAEKISGKITFGISLFGKETSKDRIAEWGKNIKKDLKSTGRSVRYVFKNEATLSSVSVEKNGLIDNGIEFIVIKKNNKFAVAKTTAVQPFESFGDRDFGRPGRDSLSGMLPPKLALMMINLANPQPNSVLLDPFCGSGTILTEGMLLGIKKILGRDLSPKAIQDSIQNIDWQKKKNVDLSGEVEIQEADVTTLASSIAPKSIDLIVTEPYLGKPLRGSEPSEQIEAAAKELIELYTKAFQNFKTILRPGGKVVMAIPQFITRAMPVVVSDKLLLEIKKLGFSSELLLPQDIYPNANFILYRRPDQRVAREIWRFSL